MKISKAIKRIVALGTGVTMVGATILGAMAAADLSNYPQPFVDNGKFNALIVVGANAKTEDVLGSIDIATSLQYSTTKTVTIPGQQSGSSVVGEGAKIETVNNKLTMNETLNSVKSKLSETELPTLLAEGTYVNDGDDQSDTYDYTQKIEFTANPIATFYKSSDYKDEYNPYVMLYNADGSNFLTYTLDFTKLAESKWYSDTTCGSAEELCDFEGSKIEFLGINYEITKAEWEDTGNVLTWEMMGGTSLNTMYEGETKTFTVNGVDYEVSVDIISDSGSTVVLTVNGQSTKELARDQTQKVAGIEIGIKKLMSNEAGEEGAGKDLVQFYLGANKVTLTDDVDTSVANKVKIGSTNVDELYVDWTVVESSDKVELQKMVFTWQPDDDLMLATGDSVKFPGLEAFSVDFAGLTASAEAEKIYVSPKSDDRIELKAPLEAGSATFSILFSDGTDFTSLGNSATAGSGVLLVAPGTLSKNDFVVLSDAANRESHIVRLEGVDNDGVATVKDISSSTTYEGSCSDTCTIYVGNTNLVLENATDGSPDTVEVVAASEDSNKIYTKGGMTIDLSDSVGSSTFDVVFTEENSNGDLDSGNEFKVIASVDTDTTISSVTGADLLSAAYEVGEDTDDYRLMTDFGTVIDHDKSGDQDSVVITYPGDELHAQVFVNAIDAQITDGDSGATYEEVQKIEVGAAILDSEAPALGTQNLIVVGGPCVNTVAAELMSNPADCAAGFTDGKATIKLFENNGKVAMLVAGYSAMDTRRASRVVAGMTPDKYSGIELEVTGTSLSDIKVTAAQ